jgi:cytochrome c553
MAMARHAFLTFLTVLAFAYVAPAAAAGDRELGQYLSAECMACHQLSGRAQGIPGIVGKPEATFIAALNEYRTKQRPNEVMQNIAGKFSQEEIAALAAYFASLQSQ